MRSSAIDVTIIASHSTVDSPRRFKDIHSYVSQCMPNDVQLRLKTAQSPPKRTYQLTTRPHLAPPSYAPCEILPAPNLQYRIPPLFSPSSLISLPLHNPTITPRNLLATHNQTVRLPMITPTHVLIPISYFHRRRIIIPNGAAKRPLRLTLHIAKHPLTAREKVRTMRMLTPAQFPRAMPIVLTRNQMRKPREA